MTDKKTTGDGLKKGLAIGSAVVAGLGAIAGAYFMYGTEAGKKKRKAVKGWALKAKGEVLEKIENMKDLTEEKYVTAVKSVMEKYNKLKADHGEDVQMLSNELMSYWNHLKRAYAPKKRAVRKSVSKAAPKRKAAK